MSFVLFKKCLTGFADVRVNTFIGSQQSSRIDTVDSVIENISKSEWGTTYLNVRLIE